MSKDYSLQNFGLDHPPPNWLYYANSKKNINSIYYIVEEGAGYSTNGEEHDFKKGFLYVMPGTTNLSYFMRDRKFYHAYIDYVSSNYAFHSNVLELNVSDYPLIEKDVETFMCFLVQNKISLADKISRADMFYKYNARVELFFESIRLDIENAFPVTAASNPQVKECIEYIQEHFYDDISVAKLARLVNLSESQFSRIFLRETGKTPYQYIKGYRFDLAFNMLMQGLPVSETAERLGFLSASAFSTSFKKTYGFSPLKILKQSGHNNAEEL